MMRKEDRDRSPVLHVFSSHFYTTLSEEGPGAVQSWTARKNIDIFSKRFIFVPINKSLHWSLCVVVNPGNIVGSCRASEGFDGAELVDSDDSLTKDSPMPCILFLDSLKAHRKKAVASNVCKWLNAEWKRMEKRPIKTDLFTKRSMPVLDPRSKCIALI